MGAFYDIYGLSLRRDETTVERFLKHFCYRESIEPISEKWIQVQSSEKYQVSEVELPLNSIAEMLEYAICNPTHCFVFYNQVALKAEIKCIILKFTWDEKIVFGISIEEWTASGTDNYLQARIIEAEIKLITESYKSYISVEYPPASDEEEFNEDVVMWRNIGDNYE